MAYYRPSYKIIFGYVPAAFAIYVFISFYKKRPYWLKSSVGVNFAKFGDKWNRYSAMYCKIRFKLTPIHGVEEGYRLTI